jgi:hypothetical protein
MAPVVVKDAVSAEIAMFPLVAPPPIVQLEPPVAKPKPLADVPLIAMFPRVETTVAPRAT